MSKTQNLKLALQLGKPETFWATNGSVLKQSRYWKGSCSLLVMSLVEMLRCMASNMR